MGEKRNGATIARMRTELELEQTVKLRIERTNENKTKGEKNQKRSVSIGKPHRQTATNAKTVMKNGMDDRLKWVR